MPPKTPRNAPCPCGSGNKYKKCCLRQHELAERTSQPVVFVDDDDLDELSNRVVDLITAGDLDGAERACDELERRYPEIVDHLERRGLLHEARGQPRRAADYYRRAAAFQSDQYELDPEFVQDLLERATQLDPDPKR